MNPSESESHLPSSLQPPASSLALSPLRMAVVGVGHLGREHARILAGRPDVDLTGVADVSLHQGQTVALRCNTRHVLDHRLLVGQVDAVVIAVPTVDHLSVARPFLQAGVAALIEKPLAASPAEAEELVALAERRRALLQVGHVERFNPVLDALRGRTIRPRFIQAERLSPYSFRSTDIGVVLDLMIHDLDLVRALVPAAVVAVEAMGVSVMGRHEDIVNARLRFADGCIADLTASRVSMRASRQMRIFSPEGYTGLDFAARRALVVRPSEHLRRQGGVNLAGLDPALRGLLKDQVFGGFLEVQTIDEPERTIEPLALELDHFIHCVRTSRRPLVSGDDGRAAIALAGRILESVRTHAWDADPAGWTGPLPVPPSSRVA